MKKSFLLACVIAFASLLAYAQTRQPNYTLMLKSGKYAPAQNVDGVTSISHFNLPLYNGYYYGIIQFTSLPDNVMHQLIKSSGIVLADYIPRNAYLAVIPKNLPVQVLTSLGVRYVGALSSFQKLHTALLSEVLPAHALNGAGKIDLTILSYKGFNYDNFYEELKSQTEIVRKYPGTNMLTVRADVATFTQLADLPFVMYIEPVEPPPTPDDTKGRSLHRSNVINSNYATGYHYNGNGVNVAIADDGAIGPHIDFTGRLMLNATGFGPTHGDMTAGICVGAGNLNPVYPGMASGANIYMYDIGSYPQIVDAVTHLTNDSIVITSTSYSQGCNEYTANTQFIDDQINQNHPLIHCFSAGNNNGANCGYGGGGAGTQYGNITGGYKQGKNVIACGNLDALEVIDNSSSHGPAVDGRIKPDICANGKDQMSTDENNTYQVGGGTSAASPGIAGINAQLFHAYKTLNGGQNPESGLIKACLLNTAKDIGNPGPDYFYGWGRVNAYRALKVLEDGRYLADSITQGNTNTHTITIPSGVQQVKVMVYWPDVGGMPGSSVNLVNNIDLTVTDPSPTVNLPLILNPTPTVAALSANAVPGIDTLNNAEQVTIDNPSAGNYTITIAGTEIPVGTQRYFVVYEFYTDEIKVTYPNGNEGFVPGEQEVLRWDAHGTAGNFTLEYSSDNGSTWNNMTSLPGTSRQYTWTVPAVLSGNALVRVTRAAITDVNDTTFTIVGLPTNIHVNYVCPDSANLSWNGVTGATGYEVYMLGAKYMDAVGTSTTTSFTIPNYDPTTAHWVSVAALGPNGARGRRAIAIQIQPGTVNCPVAIDVATNNLLSPPAGNYFDCAIGTASTVTLVVRNNGMTPISNFDVKYSLNGAAPVVETITNTINPADSIVYNFTTTLNLVAGSYNLIAWNDLSGDGNSYNDTSKVLFTITSATGSIPPVTEGFQSGSFPPIDWQVLNPDAQDTWTQMTNVIDINSQLTTTAFIDNYTYNAPGEEDVLQTEIFNLTNAASSGFAFDISYAPYSATYSDTLRLDVSIDCGATWQPQGYIKGGLTLGTNSAGGYQNSIWNPASGADWRRDSVSLSAYVGNNVIVRFVNMNQYGNYLYIDNVNLNGTPVGVFSASYANALVAYPNPSSGLFSVSVGNNQTETPYEVFDIDGRIIFGGVSKGSALKINLKAHTDGVYYLKIKNGNNRVIKLVKM